MDVDEERPARRQRNRSASPPKNKKRRTGSASPVETEGPEAGVRSLSGELDQALEDLSRRLGHDDDDGGGGGGGAVNDATVAAIVVCVSKRMAELLIGDVKGTGSGVKTLIALSKHAAAAERGVPASVLAAIRRLAGDKAETHAAIRAVMAVCKFVDDLLSKDPGRSSSDAFVAITDWFLGNHPETQKGGGGGGGGTAKKVDDMVVSFNKRRYGVESGGGGAAAATTAAGAGASKARKGGAGGGAASAPADGSATRRHAVLKRQACAAAVAYMLHETHKTYRFARTLRVSMDAWASRMPAETVRDLVTGGGAEGAAENLRHMGTYVDAEARTTSQLLRPSKDWRGVRPPVVSNFVCRGTVQTVDDSYTPYSRIVGDRVTRYVSAATYETITVVTRFDLDVIRMVATLFDTRSATLSTDGRGGTQSLLRRLDSWAVPYRRPSIREMHAARVHECDPWDFAVAKMQRKYERQLQPLMQLHQDIIERYRPLIIAARNSGVDWLRLNAEREKTLALSLLDMVRVFQETKAVKRKDRAEKHKRAAEWRKDRDEAVDLGLAVPKGEDVDRAAEARALRERIRAIPHQLPPTDVHRYEGGVPTARSSGSAAAGAGAGPRLIKKEKTKEEDDEEGGGRGRGRDALCEDGDAAVPGPRLVKREHGSPSAAAAEGGARGSGRARGRGHEPAAAQGKKRPSTSQSDLDTLAKLAIAFVRKTYPVEDICDAASDADGEAGGDGDGDGAGPSRRTGRMTVRDAQMTLAGGSDLVDDILADEMEALAVQDAAAAAPTGDESGPVSEDDIFIPWAAEVAAAGGGGAGGAGASASSATAGRARGAAAESRGGGGGDDDDGEEEEEEEERKAKKGRAKARRKPKRQPGARASNKIEMAILYPPVGADMEGGGSVNIFATGEVTTTGQATWEAVRRAYAHLENKLTEAEQREASRRFAGDVLVENADAYIFGMGALFEQAGVPGHAGEDRNAAKKRRRYHLKMTKLANHIIGTREARPGERAVNGMHTLEAHDIYQGHVLESVAVRFGAHLADQLDKTRHAFWAEEHALTQRVYDAFILGCERYPPRPPMARGMCTVDGRRGRMFVVSPPTLCNTIMRGEIGMKPGEYGFGVKRDVPAAFVVIRNMWGRLGGDEMISGVRTPFEPHPKLGDDELLLRREIFGLNQDGTDWVVENAGVLHPKYNASWHALCSQAPVNLRRVRPPAADADGDAPATRLRDVPRTKKRPRKSELSKKKDIKCHISLPWSMRTPVGAETDPLNESEAGINNVGIGFNLRGPKIANGSGRMCAENDRWPACVDVKIHNANVVMAMNVLDPKRFESLFYAMAAVLRYEADQTSEVKNGEQLKAEYAGGRDTLPAVLPEFDDAPAQNTEPVHEFDIRREIQARLTSAAGARAAAAAAAAATTIATSDVDVKMEVE